MRNALLFAYEHNFCEDPPVSTRNIDGNFFAEFTDCLIATGLEKSPGLEVTQGRTARFIEFSSDIGSLVLSHRRGGEDGGEGRNEQTAHASRHKMNELSRSRVGMPSRLGRRSALFVRLAMSKSPTVRVMGVADAVKLLRNEGILVAFGASVYKMTLTATSKHSIQDSQGLRHACQDAAHLPAWATARRWL